VTVQFLGKGDHVEGLRLLRQIPHHAEYQAVILPVEVLLGDHLQHRVQALVVQHQAAEHRLFRLHRVGHGGFQR
jgi:hypothetical protein